MKKLFIPLLLLVAVHSQANYVTRICKNEDRSKTITLAFTKYKYEFISLRIDNQDFINKIVEYNPVGGIPVFTLDNFPVNNNSTRFRFAELNGSYIVTDKNTKIGKKYYLQDCKDVDGLLSEPRLRW